MNKTNVSYGWNGTPIVESDALAILAPIFSFMVALAIIILLLIGGGYAETRYSTTAKVLSTDNNSVLLVDGAGYVWEVTDRPDLKVNDFVKVKFFNNTTDYTREDDEILDVKVFDN